MSPEEKTAYLHRYRVFVFDVLHRTHTKHTTQTHIKILCSCVFGSSSFSFEHSNMNCESARAIASHHHGWTYNGHLIWRYFRVKRNLLRGSRIARNNGIRFERSRLLMLRSAVDFTLGEPSIESCFCM